MCYNRINLSKFGYLKESVMKILIVIDMQNDFLHGALKNDDGIKIIPALAKKIEECKAQGYQIIATRDTHYSDYLSTQEGKKLPVTHCVKGTYGWQINDQIKTALGDCLIFDKPTFGSTTLADYLKETYLRDGDAQIELVGVCTDICVISNAMLIKAALPEARISVISSLCAGVTPTSHQTALDAMRACQIEIKD